MASKLLIFPTPLNALCSLQHDKGWTMDGKHDWNAIGRPGQSFIIPDDTPDRWGARLVISAPSKLTLFQRGLLVRDQHRGWVFCSDDFPLTDYPTS